MNPYKVLDLTAKAGPKEILAAAAAALRHKEHSALEIAQARQQLMDPKLRPLLDFICFVDTEPLLRPAQDAAEPSSVDALRRLEIFERQHQKPTHQAAAQ
jgi:hypothetical protein